MSRSSKHRVNEHVDRTSPPSSDSTGLFRPVAAGILMGLANAVPGVSGGTMAVVTGVFSRLIDAINEILTLKFRKRSLAFLGLIAIGLLFGLVLGSKVLVFTFERYPYYTYAFFYGLVAFSLYTLRNEIERFRLFEFLLGLALVIFPSLFGQVPAGRTGSLVEGAGVISYPMLLISGAIAGASMILPGLSGSLVLMLLGYYQTAIGYVAELPQITADGFRFLAVLGLGVLLGVWLMAKALKVWFEKARESILNFIMGLLVGSLYPITPGFHGSGSKILLLVWIAVGGAIVIGVKKLGSREI